MKIYAVLVAFGMLSGCATARLHTQEQLNSVSTRCGLAMGELMQDEIEKKLLLVVRNTPTDAQRACVARWARDNHLKAVFVQREFPS